jgi:peptide/nickel transport system substrate-binding protein
MNDGSGHGSGDSRRPWEEEELDRKEFLRHAGIVGASAAAGMAALSQPVAAAGRRVAEIQAQARQAASRRITIRLTSDIKNLDPAFEPADPDLQTIFNIYENLVSFKPGTFKTVNTLAEVWEPSKNGLQYHFKLKKGVEFHRKFGELTADDVKFSFERIAGLTKPPITSPYVNNWSALERVRVTGKYTGIIQLKRPYAPLMTLTIPGDTGQIVSRKAVEKLGDLFATQPVGTGPYEFVKWVPQQYVLLKKFSRYSGSSSGYARAPEWDEIQFDVIGDDHAAQIALQSGALDFTQIPLTATSQVVSSGFKIGERTTFGYKWIGMNLEDPMFQDINLRLAIRYAIDVPSIIAAAFEGKWPRATSNIPSIMPVGHWKKAPRYKRDLAKAAAYFAKTGLKNPTIKMTYDLNEPGGGTVAQVVQANLKDVGINVQVQGVEHGSFLVTGAAPQQDRHLFYVGFGSQPDPAQSMQWFTCDQLNVWNYMYWCNKEFTSLAAKGQTETDPAKRTKIYVRMQEIWDENANAIWVAWPSLFFAWKKGIRPSLRPDGRIIAWNFRQ